MDGVQVSVGVVEAVLELSQCPVVVVQSHGVADFHSDVRGGNRLGKRIGVGDGPLALADGVHAGTKIHSPDRLGAEFANVKSQIGLLEIATPCRKEI